MKPGRSLSEQLREAIIQCDLCIFIATHNSVKSNWCSAELGAFWGIGKPVIIYLADTSLNENKLPKQFQGNLLERNMHKTIKVATDYFSTSLDHFSSDNHVSLKARRDFPRPDALLSSAKNQLYLIGINLDLVNASMQTIHELIQNGIELRLLCLDPEGGILDAFSKFSDVNTQQRKSNIQNNILKLTLELNKNPLGKWELRVLDSFLSAGYIGIDIENSNGSIIAQSYLYKTRSDRAPTITLHCGIENYWFTIYKESIEKIWNAGRTLIKSGL